MFIYLHIKYKNVSYVISYLHVFLTVKIYINKGKWKLSTKKKLYLTSLQTFVYWIRRNKKCEKNNWPTYANSTIVMNRWNKYHFLITILDEKSDTENTWKIITDEKFCLSGVSLTSTLILFFLEHISSLTDTTGQKRSITQSATISKKYKNHKLYIVCHKCSNCHKTIVVVTGMADLVMLWLIYVIIKTSYIWMIKTNDKT